MSPALEAILQQYGSNPFQAMWFIFGHGGALIFIPVMLHMAITGWLFWLREKFKHHTPHVMYRIEVPQNNEQSMKAVEQIFVQLYGVYDVPDWHQKWWLGFVQEEFSLEIVSDGGYIAYYVRTPTYYKEMAQAAFYAHYPDAILTETEDYTKEITVEMINTEKVRVWGSEMKLEGPDEKPIKTYPLFEHGLTGKAVDPFANILEFMSRLQPGEKLWYQIMVQPSDLGHLKEIAKQAIDTVVEPTGAGHVGPDLVDRIKDGITLLLAGLDKALFGGETTTITHEGPERLTERQRLTTPEREFVEEVDKKSSRWPFHTKIRFMYFAAPKIFDDKKVRRGMIGALKLYRFINAFEEGELTRTDWKVLPWRFVFSHRRLITRARRMFWAYRSRDMERGEHEGFILSTEELASVFHFPQIEVRAPFVAKAQTRGVEPPTLLRFDDSPDATGPTVSLASGSTDVAQAPAVNVVQEQPTAAELIPPQPPASQAPIERDAPANLPFA